MGIGNRVATGDFEQRHAAGLGHGQRFVGNNESAIE
jgi:hypothetical protein